MACTKGPIYEEGNGVPVRYTKKAATLFNPFRDVLRVTAFGSISEGSPPKMVLWAPAARRCASPQNETLPLSALMPSPPRSSKRAATRPPYPSARSSPRIHPRAGTGPLIPSSDRPGPPRALPQMCRNLYADSRLCGGTQKRSSQLRQSHGCLFI